MLEIGCYVFHNNPSITKTRSCVIICNVTLLQKWFLQIPDTLMIDNIN